MRNSWKSEEVEGQKWKEMGVGKCSGAMKLSINRKLPLYPTLLFH